MKNIYGDLIEMIAAVIKYSYRDPAILVRLFGCTPFKQIGYIHGEYDLGPFLSR